MDYKFIKNAKISEKGQVTVPLEIRKYLEVDKGDYITFGINKNGVLIVSNRENVKITEK